MKKWISKERMNYKNGQIKDEGNKKYMNEWMNNASVSSLK